MNQLSQDHESGYIVLITVLVLGLVVTTVAMFLLITGTDATIASAGVESGAEAKAAAEACTQLALRAIQQDPLLASPSNGSSTIDPAIGQECNYSITGTSPNYTVNAVGIVRHTTDNYTQRIEVILDQVSPSLHVASWQDIP